MGLGTRKYVFSVVCAFSAACLSLTSFVIKAAERPVSADGLFSDANLNVVLFWGSWCGNCPAVMQDMESVRSRFEGKNVEFFAVSLDGEQEPNRYLQRRGIGMTSVADGTALLKHFEAPGVPWVVIVNDKGEVVEAPSRKVKPSQLAANVEMDLNLRDLH